MDVRLNQTDGIHLLCCRGFVRAFTFSLSSSRARFLSLSQVDAAALALTMFSICASKFFVCVLPSQSADAAILARSEARNAPSRSRSSASDTAARAGR